MNTPPPAATDANATPEQIERHLRHAAATADAHALPLPGPLAAAFLAEPVRAAGLELQPLTASHMVLFQWLGSPLITLIAVALARQASAAPEAPDDVAFSEDDVVEMIFVSSRPLRELRAAKARGRREFTEAAYAATLDRLGLENGALIHRLRDACIENFTRALATRLAHAAPPPEDGTSFTPPPASPKTA